MLVENELLLAIPADKASDWHTNHENTSKLSAQCLSVDTSIATSISWVGLKRVDLAVFSTGDISAAEATNRAFWEKTLQCSGDYFYLG